MDLTEIGAKYNDFFVPSFKIEIGDMEFTNESGVVSDLSVSTSLDKANSFSFTLNNLYDLKTLEFEELDWDPLRKEGKVEISMGYDESRKKLLVGTVKSAKPDFPSGGVPSIGVSGFGRIHELMSDKTRRKFPLNSDTDRVKDSDAVSKIFDEYTSLETVVDETPLNFPRIYKKEGQTDYAFLKERAKLYNFEVFSQLGTAYFRKSKDDAQPVIQLAYGDSLNSFDVNLDQAKDVKEVKIIGSDRRGRNKIEGRADGDDPKGETVVLRETVESKAEAEQWAKSEVERIRQNKVRGNGETVGIPDLVAGTTIQIDGVTEEFSGLYYVESADHRISTSGYTTSFQVRKGKEGR